MFRKIRRYIRDPYYALGYDLIKKHPHWMSDKYYLSVLWKMTMGYEIDWIQPKGFNEKLQWIKLYDRNPLYTTLVDKHLVKQWVEDKIGKQFIIPTIDVFYSADTIKTENLPNQFVLKCNHDSGSVVICKDKSRFDITAARQVLREGMNRNFYWEGREWPYKNVSPLIIAEEFLEDSMGALIDYKVMCFNGVPKLIQVHKGRNKGCHTQDFYDTEWNKLDLNQKHCQVSDSDTPCPSCLDKMLEFSSVLSSRIPQVRVDWYIVNDKLFFGEMTFFDAGGFDEFIPKSMEYTIGEWIVLPSKK